MAAEWFTFLVVPLLIFVARIIDVSIGTIKVIFITKGFKYYAPILGFIEVLIWLVAIQQIMQNLSNVFCYIAYAGGFATGTYVGILIEDRLAVGKVLIRIITKRDASALLENFKKEKLTVTTVGAEGPDGKVNLILSVINRKDLSKIVSIIKQFNPHSFYTIEDIRQPDGETNTAPVTKFKLNLKKLFYFHRKGK